jgi:PadR family transcriptional regulator PadR
MPTSVEEVQRSKTSQLRKGALEHCVLALLAQDERYGVELVRELGETRSLVASAGTVYPLLSRLERDGLVSTRLEASPAGPPRRYYRLTPAGKADLDAFATYWGPFRDAVDSILQKARL